jgi:septum formation protein
MNNLQPCIYLASQSPRRRELLMQIGVQFHFLRLRHNTNRCVDVNETPLQNEKPESYVERISREKAKFGLAALKLRKLPPLPVLAADTCVTVDGIILGKPKDASHAAYMLRLLSGREHQVMTAVAIANPSILKVRISTSIVRFSKLDEDTIERYLQSGEYADMAGSYAIQGQAAIFIEHISGSYSGVMGLPLFETAQLLERYEIKIF